jgi:hypothetical protein
LTLDESKGGFNFSCTDPRFLFQVFFHLLKTQADHPLVQLFDLKKEAQLSYWFDISGIQEAVRFRALNRARCLALALVDDKGEIKKEFLESFMSLYKQEGAIFFPQGDDQFIQEHILDFLQRLKEPELLKALKRFQNPLCHKWAEKLVQETLGITSVNGPTEAEIRAAVLCACLTPLRQNVGSCFATAPAILIQREQVTLLIDDLYQLLSTGKLKRTFGGIEYALPLSPSTGVGDLKKNLVHPDLNNKAGFCPGLIAAMEKMGILSPGKDLEEQGEALQQLLEKHAAGRSHFTAEELIRVCLMEKYSLREEDFTQIRQWELAQFKNSKLSIGLDPGISRRLELIQIFKQKEQEARSVFTRMCDNPLLKAWEFTLASFSEVKMEFSRWNLYSSLGLAAEEPGGIGELIYKSLDEKIRTINQKIEEYQKQYEIAFDQVRATETLLRNAGSESEARRLQAEYQSRAYHMRSCLELRDQVYSLGSNYSTLYSFLIKQYDQKFPEYFQEIYDAEMQDFQGEYYDDSPAGFRLVYKHGRLDPSLWTLIYDPEQYIETLLDFFSATEHQIAAACEWEGGEKEILDLTSAIIAHVKSPIFLETALQRMAKAHQIPFVKSPLKNLQRLEKKPWAYISGGTMTTLLKTYCCREGEFTQEEKWVENEAELLTFILDALKTLPHRVTNGFLTNPRKMMLMNSPTHAFLLLPGEEQLQKGWQEEIFTYTWVRDEIVLPNQRFYANLRLGQEEQRFLVEALCELLPVAHRHILIRGFLPTEKNSSIHEWRNRVLELLFHHTPTQAKQKQTLADKVDGFLYQALPIIPGKEWKAFVRRLLSDRFNDKVEKILNRFPDNPCTLMTAHTLRELAKGCYLLAEGTPMLSFNLHRYIATHARFIGCAQPAPLLFADTNWTHYFFGFVVNPGTMRLELWRLDRTASQGFPMSIWKQWLNGSERRTWSIFTRPFEYVMGLSVRR